MVSFSKNVTILEAERLLKLMRRQLSLAWRAKMEADLILLRSRKHPQQEGTEWKKH